MEAENSARLKRSLLSKMPAPKMINYQNGQKVLYKHGKDNQWHGPATVIGTDNKVIFLRQGRFILASSQSRVIPADGTETQPAPPAPEQSSTPSRNLNDNGQQLSIKNLSMTVCPSVSLLIFYRYLHIPFHSLTMIYFDFRVVSCQRVKIDSFFYKTKEND